MSRTPSPHDLASRSNWPIPYNDVPIFSSYAGTYRPPIAPPATFPRQFVAGFANHFPRNPVEAAVPGTVGQLNENVSISSSGGTIETSPGMDTPQSCLVAFLLLRRELMRESAKSKNKNTSILTSDSSPRV